MIGVGQEGLSILTSKRPDPFDALQCNKLSVCKIYFRMDAAPMDIIGGSVPAKPQLNDLALQFATMITPY